MQGSRDGTEGRSARANTTEIFQGAFEGFERSGEAIALAFGFEGVAKRCCYLRTLGITSVSHTMFGPPVAAPSERGTSEVPDSFGPDRPIGLQDPSVRERRNNGC